MRGRRANGSPGCAQRLRAAPRRARGACLSLDREKSATARVASRISLSSFSRFSRKAASSTLTVTLSKKASTRGRKGAIAAMAPAKSSRGRRRRLLSSRRRWRRRGRVLRGVDRAQRRARRCTRACPCVSSMRMMLVARLVPASRFLPSSVSRNFASASTRRTIISRSPTRPAAFDTARKHRIDQIMPRALLAQLDLEAVGEEGEQI